MTPLPFLVSSESSFLMDITVPSTSSTIHEGQPNPYQTAAVENQPSNISSFLLATVSAGHQQIDPMLGALKSTTITPGSGGNSNNPTSLLTSKMSQKQPPTTPSSAFFSTEKTTVDGLSDPGNQKLFILGLAILGGWILIMLLCARKELFRRLAQHYVCCKQFDVSGSDGNGTGSRGGVGKPGGLLQQSVVRRDSHHQHQQQPMIRRHSSLASSTSGAGRRDSTLGPASSVSSIQQRAEMRRASQMSQVLVLDASNVRRASLISANTGVSEPVLLIQDGPDLFLCPSQPTPITEESSEDFSDYPNERRTSGAAGASNNNYTNNRKQKRRTRARAIEERRASTQQQQQALPTSLLPVSATQQTLLSTTASDNSKRKVRRNSSMANNRKPPNHNNNNKRYRTGSECLVQQTPSSVTIDT